MKGFDRVASYRVLSALVEYLYVLDEMTQVHGTITILDFSNYTLAHETKMPLDDRRKILQSWQVGLLYN